MTDGRVLSMRGPGPLGWSRLCRLLEELALDGALTVSERLYVRAYPRGPSEGFAGGAPDWQRPFDPARPRDLDLGEDLLSAELEVEGLGARFALVLQGHRDDDGAAWSAELEVADGDPDWAALSPRLERMVEALAGDDGPLPEPPPRGPVL